jgi:hypothetical protein
MIVVTSFHTADAAYAESLWDHLEKNISFCISELQIMDNVPNETLQRNEEGSRKIIKKFWTLM